MAACSLQCATWRGCRAQGHSFSRPSMAKFADFLLLAPPLAGVLPFLHQELSLDDVKSFHPVLRALLRSFRVFSPSRAVRPPSWALAVFLRQLHSSSFASLRLTPLRSLVKMVLFFVALLASFRRSPVVFPSSEVTPVCRLSLPLFPSVSRSLFHPPLLLGCISVRLCGWS